MSSIHRAFTQFHRMLLKLGVVGPKGHQLSPTMILKKGNPSQIPYRAIHFYFSNIAIMHVGDHLFFEPAIRLLHQSGFQVSVSPAPELAFYFKALGFEIVEPGKSKPDLVISRPDFFRDLEKLYPSSEQLFLETMHSSLKKPLCEDLCVKIAKFLNITTPEGFSFAPQNFPLEDAQKVDLPRKGNIAIVSTSIHGSRIKRRFRAQKIFQETLRRIREQDPSVAFVRVGTARELTSDPIRLEEIDLDLRGQTTLPQILGIVNQKAISYVVSYDSVISHLGFMAKRETYVLLRRQFSARHMHVSRYFVHPPFPMPAATIHYL